LRILGGEESIVVPQVLFQFIAKVVRINLAVSGTLKIVERGNDLDAQIDATKENL